MSTARTRLQYTLSDRPDRRDWDGPAWPTIERILFGDMVIAGVAAVMLIVIVTILWGRMGEARVDGQKRSILRPLEGTFVTLGSATIRCPQDRRVIATDDPFAVTFDDDGLRAIPLADIRWIDGPDGQRLGGPW